MTFLPKSAGIPVSISQFCSFEKVVRLCRNSSKAWRENSILVIWASGHPIANIMVEKPFAGPISRIFSTGIFWICLMISLAVSHEIFGTERVSPEVFIACRKSCTAGERDENGDFSSIEELQFVLLSARLYI